MGKGSLGCGANMARYVLFIFNVILWICGVVLLAVGIWLCVDPDAWDHIDVMRDAGMDDPLLSTAVYVTIGVGVFIFFVGGAGCWGAWQKSSCWLLVYAALIGVTLTIQLVAVILAGVFRGKITETVRDKMTEQVKVKYGTTFSKSLTDAWDLMQEEMQCCGSVNFTDYQGSEYTKNTSYSVPASCCDPNNVVQCRKDAEDGRKDTVYLHATGCYGELKDKIDYMAVTIIGVLVGIALLEALGLIMACCLRRSITDEMDKYS